MRFKEKIIDQIKMERTALTSNEEGNYFLLRLYRDGKELGSILGIITPEEIKLLSYDT